MINSCEKLCRRRELLSARCAAQRNELSGQGRALVKKLSAFDLALTIFARCKKNPAWVVGLVTALVVIKPRRLLSILQTALLAWQTVLTITSSWQSASVPEKTTTQG